MEDDKQVQVTYTFPNQLIKAGKALYLYGNRPCPANNGGNCLNIKKTIPFNETNNGGTYLCSGGCSSNTVVDYHAYASSSTGQPPKAQYQVTFTPGPSSGIAQSNKDTHSFTRKAVTGFKQSDWQTQAKTNPCPAPTTSICANTCTDLQTNANHCGNCGTKCKTDQVCRAGKCISPPQVHLQEINIGSPDFAAIKNGGTTDVNVGGYVIFFDDSSLPDVTYTIPASTIIKAGQTLYLYESNCPNGTTGKCISIRKNIFYTPSRGGGTYLCSAACRSTTVLDYHAWRGNQNPPAATHGATFTPGPSTGIQSSNEANSSFVRQTVIGVYPTFKQSDWKVGTKTTP